MSSYNTSLHMQVGYIALTNIFSYQGDGPKLHSSTSYVQQRIAR